MTKETPMEETKCSCYCHQAKNGESYITSGCIHCKGYEIGTISNKLPNKEEMVEVEGT